jgi:hypothetical protein
MFYQCSPPFLTNTFDHPLPKSHRRWDSCGSWVERTSSTTSWWLRCWVERNGAAGSFVIPGLCKKNRGWVVEYFDIYLYYSFFLKYL